MKHPIERDRIQRFVAKNKLSHLIILYIAFTFLCSFISSIIWHFIFQDYVSGNLIFKMWYSFVYLYGYQPNIGDLTNSHKIISIFLSVCSIVLPTLLLGTVVFKILLPRKKRVVFRNKANLHIDNDNNHFIAIHSYLGSQLNFVNWKFVAYLRIDIDINKSNFPLRTYAIQITEEILAIPYTLTPTRILIPIKVIEQGSQNPKDKEQIVFSKKGTKYGLVEVFGNDVPSENKFDYEILIITSSQMPELSMNFTESKIYHSSDIDFSEDFKIKTVFDAKTNQVYVPDWSDF
ncbi:hypothetical protein [Cyclobacterium plantarum]|uniref:hypothetical protein n=1 Tax=Cyclobacterium plantarum TaxID=2716263 RepID=UPI003F713C45